MASDIDLQIAPAFFVDPGETAWRQYAPVMGAIAIALTGLALVLINPRGYIGGGWDDAQYMNAVIAWSQSGPNVGTNHWALRWPLVLGNVLAVQIFGFSRTAIMVPAILTYLACGLVLYGFIGKLAGWRAGFVAALALLTIPELGRWSTVIYPDAPEGLLWCVSLGCFRLGSDRQTQRGREWLLASGLAAGLAWSLRETALGLWAVYGLAFLLSYRIRRARYGWVALAALPAPLIEYACYWHLTGDPLYRLHADLGHIGVPSNHLAGNIPLGASPLLNPLLMSHWTGAGPVRLHWMLDPYLNLFADNLAGLIFVILAVTGWALWRARRDGEQSRMTNTLRDLCQALLVVMAANILINLYVLAVRPGPRMFLPALMAGSALIGIAFAHINIPWLRRSIAALLVIKFLITAIIIDVAPNYARVASISDQIVRSVSGPIYVNQETNLHLQFAPADFRARLAQGDASVGSYYLAVGAPNELMSAAPNPDRWTLVSAADTGQTPWTVRLLSPPVHAFGLMKNFEYPAVQARLYQCTD